MMSNTTEDTTPRRLQDTTDHSPVVAHENKIRSRPVEVAHHRAYYSHTKSHTNFPYVAGISILRIPNREVARGLG